MIDYTFMLAFVILAFLWFLDVIVMESQVEDRDHVLSSDMIASQVWRFFFSNVLGESFVAKYSLRSRVTSWRSKVKIILNSIFLWVTSFCYFLGTLSLSLYG